MTDQKRIIAYNVSIGILILAIIAFNNLSFDFKSNIRGLMIAVKTNNIRGKIIGPDGPVANASVWLSKLSDAECGVLNDKVLNSPDLLLSESEYHQIENCMSPFATATTDVEGNYTIKRVPAGWYHLSFQWQQNQAPTMALEPIPTKPGYNSKEIGAGWRNSQLLEVTVFENVPNTYFMAIAHPSINFSPDHELVIDFIW